MKFNSVSSASRSRATARRSGSRTAASRIRPGRGHVLQARIGQGRRRHQAHGRIGDFKAAVSFSTSADGKRGGIDCARIDLTIAFEDL